MRFRRLGWAGVELECSGETLVIDYVQDVTPLVPVMRNAHETFPKASHEGGASVALLTHLHADHADADAIAEVLRPGAPVFRPEAVQGTDADRELTAYGEAKTGAQHFKAEIAGIWFERQIGPFHICSAPAVDGFGDPQVSWIVECGGTRFLHAGDTLFHGYWWKMANRFKGFDVAFLPINAPICVWPHLQPPSPLEAVLSPEEAVIAAHLTRTETIVPIHYGTLNKPGLYTETPNPLNRLRARAADYSIGVQTPEPGQWVDLGG